MNNINNKILLYVVSLIVFIYVPRKKNKKNAIEHELNMIKNRRI